MVASWRQPQWQTKPRFASKERQAASPSRGRVLRTNMQRKVMISCAVTGSADTPGRNPAVPVTPAQIAQSALDAAKAGAAIVHIHVRNPETARPSMNPAHYREVVERIRGSGSDVLINLTTGPGARFAPGADDPLKPEPGTTMKSAAER